MSLSVQGMKDFIYPPLKDLHDASQASKMFCEKICEYINKNAVITYSWLGVSGDSTDPITIFTTTSTGKGFVKLSNINSVGAGVDYWCLEMSKVIQTDMSMNIPKTWTLSPLLFNPYGKLKIIMSGETDFNSASTNFCTQFLTSFKSSFLNTTPVSGTHGKYTGTATMTSIA